MKHDEFKAKHNQHGESWMFFMIWLTLEKIAEEIHALRPPISPPEQAHFEWSVGPVTVKNSPNIMDLTITNEQQVNVTLKPVSAKGKPVALDGAPVWAVTAGSSTIVPASDGLSCLIVSGDDAGDSEITVSADADLGQGVVTISDAIRVTVVGAQAQALGLAADAPTVKP